MRRPLTELEQRVLDYLFEYLRRNTYQPSVREIGTEFSIKSTKTVSEILQSLADKGWVERDPSRSRGVRLLDLDTGAQPVTVPFFEGSDTMQMDRRLAGAPGVFVAGMKGDHLRADGVHNGDLLLIEPADPARVESGDLLFVDVGGTVTVRRCTREAATIVLEPIEGEKVSVTLTARQAKPAVKGRVATIIRRVRPLAEHATPLAATPAG